MESLKLVLVEQDPILLHRYREYIDSIKEIECVSAVSSVKKLLLHIDQFPDLDIVLLDTGVEEITRKNAILNIKFKMPSVEVIILADDDDNENVLKVFRAGANGYLLKGFNQYELRKQLLTIFQGGSPISPSVAKVLIEHFNPPEALFSNEKNKFGLTPTEKIVLHQLIKGLSYQEIGTQMGISINSVRSHVKNIYKKLNVNSRAKLTDKYQDFCYLY